MTTATQQTTSHLNGLNVDGLRALSAAVAANPAQGQTRWSVATQWQGGTVSRSRVRGCEIGGQWIDRPFSLTIDEPLQLGGTNTHPNPQEYLLSALNACMTVGYVAAASLFGIELETLEIETEGNIDLRGFLGLDPSVPAGYDALHYTVRIKGNGTPAQFRQIHDLVASTSPNHFNLAHPIPLTADLQVL
jgi:uncharacterized OsmC-like protein